MSASGGQALFVANRDGKGAHSFPVRIRPSPRLRAWRNGFPWSPDGSKILFSAGNGDTGQSDLYVVAADGTTDEQRVTADPGRVRRHVVAGRTRIAYIAAEPSEHGFPTVANADGSNRKRLIDTPCSG